MLISNQQAVVHHLTELKNTSENDILQQIDDLQNNPPSWLQLPGKLITLGVAYLEVQNRQRIIEFLGRRSD